MSASPNETPDADENTLISALRDFVAERDWAQFHSPENLAKSISIEAGELLERFQWGGEFDESAGARRTG